MNLVEITNFLNTYSGRDKIMRTLCYTTKCAAGLVKSEVTSTRLLAFGSHLSACRTILRLFDDIPMLSYTLSYGLGNQEKDQYMRFLNVLRNGIDQVFYPLEHLAWAHDSNIIKLRKGSDTLWVATTVCWVLSLYIGLMKALRSISVLQSAKICLKGVESNGVANGSATGLAMTDLVAQQQSEFLTAVRCIADLGHAINSLPDGWLWSGKLNRWQVGALGSISSILGLYQSLRASKS